MEGIEFMKLSIIIPLYNKEKEIKHTLDTLFNQSFSDFEVIIINDGSTDGSEEIIERYDNKKIRLFNQENSGAAAARNKGVELAQNEWVAFLDADDEWKSNYLEKIVAAIKEYPQAILIGTNYEILENGETIVLDYPMVKKTTGIMENYFVSGREYTPLWTSAVVMKKDVFQELGGFPTECKTCEDVDLWCKVALRGQIIYINEPLAVYNRGNTNMLSKSKDTTCYYPFLDEYGKYIKSRTDLLEAVRDYVVYRQLVAVSFQLFNTGNKELAKTLLKKIKDTRIYRKKYFFLKLMNYMPVCVINLYTRYLTKIIHKRNVGSRDEL